MFCTCRIADMWHLPIETLMFKQRQIKTKDANLLVEHLESQTHVPLHPSQDILMPQSRLSYCKKRGREERKKGEMLVWRSLSYCKKRGREERKKGEMLVWRSYLPLFPFTFACDVKAFAFCCEVRLDPPVGPWFYLYQKHYQI